MTQVCYTPDVIYRSAMSSCCGEIYNVHVSPSIYVNVYIVNGPGTPRKGSCHWVISQVPEIICWALAQVLASNFLHRLWQIMSLFLPCADSASRNVLVLGGSVATKRKVALLLKHGRAEDPPFMVVENGSCPQQRVVTGRPDDLDEGTPTVRSPALMILSEVTSAATGVVRADHTDRDRPASLT